MSLPPVLKILAHIVSRCFSFHLFSLGVLEFSTGGVLAITPCSWRARYLMSDVGVLDYSFLPLNCCFCYLFGLADSTFQYGRTLHQL